MTFDEWWAAYLTDVNVTSSTAIHRAAWDAATAAERERCMDILKKHITHWNYEMHAVADRIRSGELP